MSTLEGGPGRKGRLILVALGMKGTPGTSDNKAWRRWKGTARTKEGLGMVLPWVVATRLVLDKLKVITAMVVVETTDTLSCDYRNKRGNVR
jgi:hypothetical protein